MKTHAFLLSAVIVGVYLSAGEPPKPPAETKTGSYTTTFTERSPLSAQAELVKRIPPMAAKGMNGPDYKLEGESFCITVPASYKPEKPYGLLVYINSGDSGAIPNEFKPLLEKFHLIWIGANKGGNERPPINRAGMALDAVHNIKKLYNIDPDRVYLSGVSGGGRASSYVAPGYPDVFNGVMYLVGCNPLAVKLPPELQDRMKRLNSYAFLTGDKDFNQKGTKEVFDDYQRAKFAHTIYLQAPGMGHGVPPTEWLEKGLVFLDEPLVAAAKAMHTQALDLQKREKLGQALKLFSKVAARASDQPFGKEAAEQAAAIIKKRDDVLANAQQLIDSGKGSEAAAGLEKLLRDYEDAAGNARELLKKARK